MGLRNDVMSLTQYCNSVAVALQKSTNSPETPSLYDPLEGAVHHYITFAPIEWRNAVYTNLDRESKEPVTERQSPHGRWDMALRLCEHCILKWPAELYHRDAKINCEDSEASAL
jgi:hypothetical protein